MIKLFFKFGEKKFAAKTYFTWSMQYPFSLCNQVIEESTYCRIRSIIWGSKKKTATKDTGWSILKEKQATVVSAGNNFFRVILFFKCCGIHFAASIFTPQIFVVKCRSKNSSGLLFLASLNCKNISSPQPKIQSEFQQQIVLQWCSNKTSKLHCSHSNFIPFTKQV